MKKKFQPTASLEILRRRAEILKSIRRFFDDKNFWEVETPILSRDVVVDRYIEPIEVSGDAIGVAACADESFWLQTSPEFAMKRILAAGADAIFQIARAFRAEEFGSFHNHEFSMLEWYRVGDDMHAGMNLLAEFATAMFATDRCELTSYRQAFEIHAGVDGLSEDVTLFEQAAQRLKIDVTATDGCRDIDPWRNLLLSHAVQPRLGRDVPEIVFDWPASQSALAIVRPGSPPVAERFELYFRGVELANGYHELLSSRELADRNERINQLRTSDGKRRLPGDSELINAMKSGLPPCSGVALGVDRLVMLLTDSKSVADVMAFSLENC